LTNSEVGANSADGAPIAAEALTYLKKNGETSVKQLYEALKVRNPTLSETEVTDLVWQMVDKNQVTVEDIPPSAESLRAYLGIWERNLGLYASLAISILTILAIYTVPPQLPLVAIRWVLGSVFVLFIPGYVTVEALFPKSRELDGIERVALSVGLSLALVPLVGLLLNYTPWGIRLTPILISLTILTVALCLAGLLRKFQLRTKANL
jgi:hypothetical protein